MSAPASLGTILLLVIIILWCAAPSEAKIVEGRVNTRRSGLDKFRFLTRFCFLSSTGVMNYFVRFKRRQQMITTQTNDNLTINLRHELFMYYDEQWDYVYKNRTQSCKDKRASLPSANYQIIELTTRYIFSGCKLSKDDFYTCQGKREFVSRRDRWWYIVLAACDSTQGIGEVTYRFEMYNDPNANLFRKHFPADEFYILEVNMASLGVHLIMFCFASFFAYLLIQRRYLHATYRLYMISLFLYCVYLAIHVGSYFKYGLSGLQQNQTVALAQFFEFLSNIVFLVFLLLMGKGYTVTRGKISSNGKIKMVVFVVLYSFVYFGLYLYINVMKPDPAEVVYRYESPPGIGLNILRIIAWAWFTYGTIITIKKFPKKATFYYIFYIGYTIWFYAAPLMVLIASTALGKWLRAKTVNGVEALISIAGFLVFLVLSLPDKSNKWFPYHVRTTQIEAVNGEEEPEQVYGPEDPYNVQQDRVLNLFSQQPATMHPYPKQQNGNAPLYPKQNNYNNTYNNPAESASAAAAASPPDYSSTFSAMNSYTSSTVNMFARNPQIPTVSAGTSETTPPAETSTAGAAQASAAPTASYMDPLPRLEQQRPNRLPPISVPGAPTTLPKLS